MFIMILISYTPDLDSNERKIKYGDLFVLNSFTIQQPFLRQLTHCMPSNTCTSAGSLCFSSETIGGTRLYFVFSGHKPLHKYCIYSSKEVQVGKDQEKAQSERDSHSKNRGGKKTKLTIRYLYHET